MNPIKTGLQGVVERIRKAEQTYGRQPGSVRLLAVSKTRTANELREAHRAGQQRFGESYLQEALEKIEQLGSMDMEWHFIGRIQSNKTRPIAENFAWVHSVENLRQAARLNEQRPNHLPPLNVCLQVKVDQEESKGGVEPGELTELIAQIEELPRLHLRGLMTLPAPAQGFEAQCHPFRTLRQLRDRCASPRTPLYTLSMGMSADLEAAIAEGATIVRVGTAIFGPRNPILSRGRTNL